MITASDTNLAKRAIFAGTCNTKKECQYCRKKGNDAKECWNNPDIASFSENRTGKKGGKTPKPCRNENKLVSTNKIAEEDFEILTTTSALLRFTDPHQWRKRFYNSGATNHISNSRVSFEALQSRLRWMRVGTL